VSPYMTFDPGTYSSQNFLVLSMSCRPMVVTAEARGRHG